MILFYNNFDFPYILFLLLILFCSSVLLNILLVSLNTLFINRNKFLFLKNKNLFEFRFLGFDFITKNAIVFAILSILFFEFFLYKYLSFFGKTELFILGTSLKITYNLYFGQLFGISLILLFFVSVLFLQIKIKVESIILLHLLCIFVFTLFCSNDLIGFMLSLEGLSFILYILASNSGIVREKTKVKIAGTKYLILGLFSSALMLYGFSLLYGFSGLFNFDDLFLFFKYLRFDITITIRYNLIIFSLLFIIFGFLFKLSVAPFHVWLVDVYKGVEDHITFFFSIFTKPVILLVFILKFSFIFEFYEFKILFYILGWLSIIFGSFGAIVQTNFKALVAYSAISNIGYICLILSIGNLESYVIAIFYLLIYTFTMFFFFILYNFSAINTENEFIQNIVDLKGSFFSNKILSFVFVIVLFSLMGLPPFIGFLPKFLIIFKFLVEYSYLSVFFLIALNVIGSFYYLRIIKYIFFYNTFYEIKLNYYSKHTNLLSFVCVFFGFMSFFLIFFVREILSFCLLFFVIV